MPQSGTAQLDRMVGAVTPWNRTTYETNFSKRPIRSEDILITTAAPTLAQMALIEQAHPEFEADGTNATAALTTFSTGGGITLTTAGADEDQQYIEPRSTANQSGPGTWDWGTDDEIAFRVRLKTPATITTMKIFAGFFLSIAEPFAQGTDADAVYFLYSTDSTTSTANWLCNYNIGGTDKSEDSGVAIVASTTYDLALFLDTDRKPHFFINGAQITQGTAMTTAIDLIPFCGVETAVAAARAVTLRKLAIGKTDND